MYCTGIRMKRVTDPLDDKVKERITGFSSGSEHSAPADDDIVFSPTFDSLYFNFGSEGIAEETNINCYETHVDDDSLSEETVKFDSIETLLNVQDSFKNAVLRHVYEALQVFSCVKSSKEILQRNVMAYLSGYGFDVAICKSKWESSGGITGGNNEFIDVSHRNIRYIVILDFASEFGIARPTNSYERLLQLLPKVFIGKTEELKQILKMMSAAGKQSLKSRGLHLPPWRKHRYMQNKWLGSYRRTTNLFPASFSAKNVNYAAAVKCREVGFDLRGGLMSSPSTAHSS